MKSILITTGIFSPEFGGPASYARALGGYMAREGVKVTILTYSSVSSHTDDKQYSFTVLRVWKGIPWGLRHLIFLVRAYINARRVDGVLALNAVSAGYLTSLATKLAGKKFIVRIVGDYAWEIAIQTGRTYLLIDEFQKSAKSGRIARLDRIQRRVCQRADSIIVPSRYLGDLVKNWGIDEKRISIIYNGVDMAPANINKEDARRQLGISGNILFSLGRLVPWKGFRMLIKMMPQLLQVNQFFRLVIAGDGPDMKMLRSVVHNLGLERKVFLVGPKTRDELAVYFAASDIFILNTGYEGFSHQVLEAMSCGVPVITTSVGGNREVIVQGENGFLVKYNDEFNLVEAIKTLWRQPELREQMKVNAHETVKIFSIERMLNDTLTLLNSTFK